MDTTIVGTENFVRNASRACRGCKNFASESCPTFAKAMKEYGFSKEELSESIKKDQQNRDLKGCKNH